MRAFVSVLVLCCLAGCASFTATVERPDGTKINGTANVPVFQGLGDFEFQKSPDGSESVRYHRETTEPTATLTAGALQSLIGLAGSGLRVVP